MGDAALRGQVTMILRRRVDEAQSDNIASGLSSSLSMTTNSVRDMQSLHNQGDQRSESQILQSPTYMMDSNLNNSIYPYDVIVSRNDNESFGFVIISSSNQYYGSTIGNFCTSIGFIWFYLVI